MNRSFGVHINSARTARNVSLPVLAENTGISESELRKLESGAIYASRDQVCRLASYFEVNEAELLQLNQASRITAETGRQRNSKSGRNGQPTLLRSPSVRTRRIENMKRDLDILGSSSVTVKLHAPVPSLRPYIDSIVYCKGHDLGHAFEKTLPDGTAQLQIVIGDGGRDVLNSAGKPAQHLSKAWVMGTNSLPVTYRLSEVEGIIYVRFRPSGLYAFTGMHQAELNNLVVDAGIVFGSAIDHLWEALASCGCPGTKISHVETFFLEKLRTIVIAPDMITYMLKHVHLPLAKLAEETGYSTKYLTKTFQRFVGVGPKTFQRIQRFHSTVSELNHLPGGIDWADVVFQHGYHDQAHFIKDFRHFSGLTPQSYLALGQSCPRYLHSSHLPEQQV